MDDSLYIGIDISKDSFDAVIFDECRKKPLHRKFDNNEVGFNAFISWTTVNTNQLNVVMEATNVFWEELAYFLHDSGAQVSVVNPKLIKNYALGQNQRGKTDKMDATVIARYAAKENPKEWTPPSPAARCLMGKVRQLEHLRTLQGQERTRLKMLRETGSIASVNRHLAYLQTEIKQLEKELDALIKSDDELYRCAKLLLSVPAIGKTVMPVLLAYLLNGQRFKNGKAAATFMGLTPMLFQSGTSVLGKARISKIGPSDVRGILFMPAMAFSFGLHKNGIYKGFVDRLVAKGKATNQVVCALMRKIVSIAQGVLKSQKPFDPSFHQNSFLCA